MSEHFTKTTVEAKFLCKPCGKPTMHYVFDGRRGGCQACILRREVEARLRTAEEERRPAPAEQTSLF